MNRRRILVGFVESYENDGDSYVVTIRAPRAHCYSDKLMVATKRDFVVHLETHEQWPMFIEATDDQNEYLNREPFVWGCREGLSACVSYSVVANAQCLAEGLE